MASLAAFLQATGSATTALRIVCSQECLARISVKGDVDGAPSGGNVPSDNSADRVRDRLLGDLARYQLPAVADQQRCPRQ